MKNFLKIFLFLGLACILNASSIVHAGDPNGLITLKNNPQAPIDYVWVLICAFLVFLMQAGFALVEAGFCQAKNVTNLMMKNLMDFVMGSLAFFAVGYALMMGKDWHAFIYGILISAFIYPIYGH